MTEEAADFSASPGGRRVSPAWTFMGLATLAGLCAYAPAFGGAILPDDLRAIVENPSIRSLLPLSGPFSPPLGTSLSGRPVANLTFALNYAFGGLNFFGYHLLNILILILASTALFSILRVAFLAPSLKWKKAPDEKTATLLSGATALVWLLHPIGTQAVTHLTQRVESLMALFFLLTFLFSLKGFSSAKKVFWHVSALAAFFLGLGTKEVIIAAPFLVLLYRLVMDRRGLFAELRENPLLYAGFALGLILMAVHVSKGEQLSSAAAPFGRWQYFVTQTVVIFHYLRLVAVPHPLCYDYRLPILSFASVWPFTAAFFTLACCTIFLCIKRRPLGFVLAWFLVILLPTSSFLPLPQTMTDYRPFLPGASLLAAGAGGLYALYALRPSKKSAAALITCACVIMAVFGALTFSRNRDYSSSISLWADTAKKRPKNYLAHNNLGVAYMEKGMLDDARLSFEKAVQYNPLYYEAYLSLGVVLARQGRLAEGRKNIEKALSIKPDYPEAHLSLGSILVWEGKSEAASGEFERAAALDPRYVNAHLNLGLLLKSMGRTEEARTHLKMACELAPGRADIKALLEQK